MMGSSARLGDLCDLVSEPVRSGARPDALYLGLEHLAPGRLVRIGGGQAADMRSNTTAFKSGDVLYGKLRPYLDKAVLADRSGVCTTELLVLRAKRDVDPRFLAVFVHSHDFIEYAVAGTTGVQHPRTSWAHIREFETPAFKIEEQRQLSDLLWFVHEAVVRSEKLDEEAKALKRAAMQTQFTRGLRGEPQKETDIGPRPESWEVATVGSVAKVKGGKRMPKGVSLTSNNTGRPYIRVTDFKHHGVDTDHVLFVPNGYESVISRYTISSEDVYISIAGTIGLVGQVPQSLDGANLTENAAKITVTDKNIAPRFIMYALASDACKHQITQSTATNAQPKLALTRIEQINLPLPSIAEQQEIVFILDAVDRKIDLHRRKRSLLKKLFRTLLHKLMTREVRLDDLDLAELT